MKPIGVLSITRIVRAYAWLNIGNIPGFRTKNSQKGTRIHGAGSDLSVAWLYNGASNGSPIFLKLQLDKFNSPKFGSREEM